MNCVGSAGNEFDNALAIGLKLFGCHARVSARVYFSLGRGTRPLIMALWLGLLSQNLT